MKGRLVQRLCGTMEISPHPPKHQLVFTSLKWDLEKKGKWVGSTWEPRDTFVYIKFFPVAHHSIRHHVTLLTAHDTMAP